VAVESGIQFTWGPAFFANGGGEEFMRLAYSREPPERELRGREADRPGDQERPLASAPVRFSTLETAF